MASKKPKQAPFGAVTVNLPKPKWGELKQGVGEPLDCIVGWGNQKSRFGSYRFGPGDTLFAITTQQGVLYLLGKMTVAAKGQLEDFPEGPFSAKVQRYVDAAKQHTHYIFGEEASPLSARRALAPEFLTELGYTTSRGVELFHNVDAMGRIQSSAFFDGVRYPTQESIEVLDRAFAGPPTDERLGAAGKLGQELLQLLFREPDHRETSQVLADLLLEQGEPMGEITQLELRLAELSTQQSAADKPPKEARQLKSRIKALVNQHFARLIGRPGGYPFTPGWAPTLF